MRNAVSEFDKVTFISGLNLLEHKPELYRELTLHPNDDGFEQYNESLKKFIKYNKKHFQLISIYNPNSCEVNLG